MKHKKGLIIALILFVIYGTAVIVDNSNNNQEPVATPKSSKVELPKITTRELLRELNKYRADHGVSKLQWDDKLEKSATLKCKDMAKYNYYDHKNPKTGKQGYSYITDVGYLYGRASENLNAGIFLDAEEVVENWAESKPHKKAMLDKGYTRTGFAVCKVKKFPGERVFVNHFAQPPQAVRTQTNTAPQTDAYDSLWRQPQTTTRCEYTEGYDTFLKPSVTCRSY